MLIDYYQEFLHYLKRGVPPAPQISQQIVNTEPVEEEPEDMDDYENGSYDDKISSLLNNWKNSILTKSKKTGTQEVTSLESSVKLLAEYGPILYPRPTNLWSLLKEI